MITPSDNELNQAAKKISTTVPQPSGYRVVIRPLPSVDGLKAGEAEIAPTLASSGFIAQSKNQTERESRGSHMGILCAVGEGAFKDMEKLAEVGDVVVFNRYAGQRIDIPPGSGKYYHFCNDEDILGRYV